MWVQNGRAIPSLIRNTVKGNFDVIIDVVNIFIIFKSFILIDNR
jgi:hypothetical protein